jgi:hypothetical protein
MRENNAQRLFTIIMAVMAFEGSGRWIEKKTIVFVFYFIGS